MKHPSTRAVFAHWNTQRGTAPAPRRSDINPIAIRHALPDTIMLAADFADNLRFRLAGTRACALFCREIKGETFVSLWSEASRGLVSRLLTALTNENAGAVAGVSGHDDYGDRLELELLLLPLAHTGQARTRAIGVLTPTEQPYWLGARPLLALEITTLRHIGQSYDERIEPPALRGPSGGRVRHGFIVYSGGRERPTGTQIG